MRGRRGTVAWLLVAAVSVLLWRLDGGRDTGPSPVVDVRTGARPLLPEDVRARLGEASVRIERPGRPALGVVRGRAGAVATEDGRPAGPVDPAAFDALVEDLRQVRIRRSLAPEDFGALHSAWTVEVPDGGPVRFELGARTADGGRAARLADGRVVAVDPFLESHAAADVRAYLLRRLLPVEAGEVRRVEIGSSTLERDGGTAWAAAGKLRLRVSEAAAEAAVARVVAAPLSDFARPTDGEAEPWDGTVRVETVDGRTFEVRFARSGCGRSAVRVDRGPGYRACASAAAFEPFDPKALFDRRLLPIRPGAVIRAEVPGGVRLVRRPGGWAAEREVDGASWRQDLSEARVFAFLDGLAAARLDPNAPRPSLGEPVERLRILADGGVDLEIACGPAACRRPPEPAFALEGGRRAPSLVPDPQQLRSERLVTFRPEQVVLVALEPAGPAGVAEVVADDGQGLVLRAPTGHPFPRDAVDGLAFEALVSVAASLRGPVVPAEGAVERRIRIELADGGAATVALHEGCVAASGPTAVALAPAACRTLGATVLYRDPLRDLLRRADAVRVRAPAGSPPVALVRVGTGGADPDDVGRFRPASAADEPGFTAALAALRRAAVFRAQGLAAGPTGPPGTTFAADVAGRTIEVELGPEGRWARFAGADWFYVAEDVAADGSAAAEAGEEPAAGEDGGQTAG